MKICKEKSCLSVPQWLRFEKAPVKKKMNSASYSFSIQVIQGDRNNSVLIELNIGCYLYFFFNNDTNFQHQQKEVTSSHVLISVSQQPHVDLL